MNIDQRKYGEIIADIADIEGPYFGGVVAYLNAVNSLALLEKLFSRLAGKSLELQSFYLKSVTLIVETRRHAEELAGSDGRLFAILNQPRSVERHETAEQAIGQQQKFISDLSDIVSAVQKSLDLVKGSIKADLVMIEEMLIVVSNNIACIINFEKKKLG